MSFAGIALISLMVGVPILIGLALLLLAQPIRESRRVGLGVLLFVLGFSGGVMWNKATFINNHIDMCADDTSGYFRQYNRFDPYCEVFEWND